MMIDGSDFTALTIPGNCSLNPLQMQCGNGACISFSKFRDCVNDCSDGIDEGECCFELESYKKFISLDFCFICLFFDWKMDVL